jgi:hypothetical protein
MAFSEWSNNKKKKKNNSSSPKKASSFSEYSNAKLGITEDEDDIAPVKDNSEGLGGNKDSWFKSGGFSDGYQFGDFTKTLNATMQDLELGIVKGAGRMVEGLVDLGTYGVAGVADAFGADEFADKTRKVAQYSAVDEWTKGYENKIDKYSILGDKADNIAEGVGQVGAIILTGGAAGAAGLSGAATSAITTGALGLSSMGSGMTEAYEMGATDGQAFAYGAATGAIEAASALIFGGLGKGIKALGFSKGLTSIDDVLAKKLSKTAAKFITSEAGQKVVGNALEYGVKSSAEGLEEVIAGFGTAIAKDAILLNEENEEEFRKILDDENLLEQFVVGSIVSGITQGGDFVKSTAQGRDFITGLSKNEQTVVDKVYEQRLAEESENRTLSKLDKNKLYERVVEEMKRGYVTTDEIESILGGETYKGYKDLADKENSLKSRRKAIEEEIKVLVKTPESQFTVEQREKLNSLREESRGIKDTLTNLGIKTAKRNLFNEVNQLTSKDTYLRESYNDLIRQTQDIEIDESKYKGTKFEEAAKKTIANARNAGASNSNRVRDFVEFSAKYSSVSGTVVDFKDDKQVKQILENQLEAEIATLEKSTVETDKQKLAEMQDMLKQVQDGEIKVNGVKTKDGVAINIDSPNYLNTVLGHEITHFLEGKNAYEPLQKAIFKYAKSKGDYEGRRSVLDVLYKNVKDTTVDYELTADLVGDYLFTEYDFIKNLSTENRNVFQYVFDQIKYAYKLATAGSKEARELEKVMHQFENVLRESAAESQTLVHNEEKINFSLRTKPAPQKTQEVYKLMRLKDGEIYPLFIDSTEPLKVGEWYDADSPNLDFLKEMPSGVFLVDANNGTYQTFEEYLQESGERKTKYPSKNAIEKATAEGKRWVFIEDTAKAQKRFGGETRKYWNIGINGSGGVSTFSMRPGYHAGSLPTMRQIGKGANKNLRDDSFVWTVGEVPADIDYQAEAEQNPDKDIPTHIPEDGYYLKATNADKVKSQADRVGWYVAGAYKINRIISDSEARQVIDNWNSEHPDTPVEYDYDRESGMDFDAEQMKLVPKSATQYSLSKDNEGNQLSKAQGEFFKDSKVRDENGTLKVVYHGTRKADFTEFKRNINFFTDNKEMADSYSPNGEMYEGYLNITKPYEIDAAGEKWSKVPIDEATKRFLQEYGASVFKEGGKWRTTPADIAAAIEEAVDNGDLDYDGIIIKNIDDTGSYYKGEGKHLGTDYIVFNSNQFKNADNTNPTDNPDIRFSLSKSVEETKDLVAVHNLREDKLLKSLNLGGLPMPSIAIVRAKEGHNNFGNISLVFGKKTIDPKLSRSNKVYSADGWTPTYPQIEYKLNTSAQEEIESKINNLVPSDIQKGLGGLYLDAYNLEHTLNRSSDIVSTYKNNYAMKYAFLRDSGVDLTLPMKNASLSRTGRLSDESIIEVAETFSEDELLDILNGDDPYKYEPDIRNIAAEGIRKKYRDKPHIAEALMPKEELSLSKLRECAESALNYKINGIQQEIDYKEATTLINDSTDTAKYDLWLKKLFSNIVAKEGIRNDKDLFTPSGNRRSFEALHYEHTLENVVKAMKEQGTIGIGGFGGNNIMGASVVEYDSIEKIKKKANERMVSLSEDEYDKIREGFTDRFLELASSLPIHKDSFSAVDDAANMLCEAVMKYKTKSGMANYLRNESKGWANYSDHIVDDLVELVDDIRDMPASYFEAKPQRAVGFDEVATAIIPDNASDELKAKLAENNIPFVEYESGNEQARLDALNSLEDAKFSLSNEGEKRTLSGNYRFSGKDFRVKAEQDIAPVAKNATTTEQVAPTVTENYSETADISPIADEKTQLQAEIDEAKAEIDSVMEEIKQLSNQQQGMTTEEVRSRVNELTAKYEQATKKHTDLLKKLENFRKGVESGIEEKPLKQLSKRISETLGQNRSGRKQIENVIQWFAQDRNLTREDLHDKIAEKFGAVYVEQTYDEIANIKKELKDRRIFVSDEIKRDFAEGNGNSFGQFMKNNFGKIIFSKNGIGVDVLYQELSETYPLFFPDDIVNPADQLRKIADVANLSAKELSVIPLDEDTINEATDLIYDSVLEYENFEEIVPMTEEEANALQDAKSWADAKLEGEPKTRKQLHNNIMNDVKATFSSSGFDFDDVLSKAKNLSTFSTVDNTPQRVMEKALGYTEGQILSDLTVNKVAQNESEGIKWLNSFTDRKNGLLAQISKQYGIKPGSKESAAAQMYAEGFYVNENNDIIAYGDAELAQDFPNEKVRNNIKGLAKDERIRQIYDETLAKINASRTRNAYPEIQKLDNYFLHFRAMEDTFSKLGLPFNPNDIRAKDLPTDLNGVTADLKPGQPYFASAMHRTGKRTSFDLLGGLERYLTSAKNQIYHIDDIQTLRALRNYIADTYGQASGLENIDMLTEEEAQEKIEQVYGSHLSTFAKFLNEEANVLAGKTALIDRGLEGIIGRRGMTFFDTVNKQTGSNMVGFNIPSSLTNFLPVAQTFAKTNKFDFLKAFTQTVSNKLGSIVGKGDNFAENSPVIIRRKGADRFYRTPFQKVGDAGYVLMSAVDDISTELIARTKYNELTRKGMSEQQAHFETDKWVSRLMGDRSLGQQPQLYNSKALGVFTKFQLEVRNQLDSQFYDTIQEAKVSNEYIENGLARNAKTAAKVTSTFVQLAVVQHLFGKAFESVAGYNPAFDIISTLATMFGFDDDEESEDTVLDNIEQGFFELLEDLPYTSTFTGGRIPISSALPITELIKGTDSYGNEKSRAETLLEVAPYYVLPGGYGQIKKTYQGLNMFSDDHPVTGSYTDSGNLRFPVEDTPMNRVQAAIFGQYASENAREYFDNGYAPLKEKQIQEYQDVDIPIKDYWEYREGLAKQDKLEDKLDYIAGLDLPVSKKNILANNVTDRKNKVDLEDWDDYNSLEEFDYAANNPGKYALAKSVGGYSEYKTYSKKLNGIKSDKDAYGKSINGSRKEKVLNYINSLDADYETKLILYKSEYPSDDTYNMEIIDYLNNRSDISYDEMVAILKELGFTVTSDGMIYWE